MVKTAWLLDLAALPLIAISAWGCSSPATPPSSTILGTTTDNAAVAWDSNFVLRSPEATDGGTLPVECGCDGDNSTLPLEWSGEPAGTQCFALIMYTIPAPGESHWYWVLYDIPAGVHGLARNSRGIGTLGNNSVNGRTEYAPPCSKGPGPKLYTFTLYALSASPNLQVAPAQVSRDVLLAAIQDVTLASASLNLNYTRQNGGQQ